MVSQLLSEFDSEVESARAEYSKSPARSTAAGFRDAFASFALYDIERQRSVRQHVPEFVRLDLQRQEPILWRRLYKPFARLLMNDPDIRRYYAGFATLFTSNPGDTQRGSQRTYYSAAIDVPLDAAGFPDAFLSRAQFINPRANPPLPLTAVCLNPSGDEGFTARPIIFYWSRYDAETPPTKPVLPKGLDGWGHVFVSARIPYSEKTGLDADLTNNRFFHSLTVKSPPVKGVTLPKLDEFTEDELYRRLRRFVPNDEADNSTLAMRLAWTVAYYAYGCEQFRSVVLPKTDAHINHLAIVCAPASYGAMPSAALYVPIICAPSDPHFSRTALKVLYLSRALGMPLERLKEFEEGTSKIGRVFAHQTSATIDSIIETISELPPGVCEAMGPSLIARLHLLRATIHSYRSKQSKIDPGPFPYQWQNSTSVLGVYRDIGIQLGLVRAQDAENDEVRRVAQVSMLPQNQLGQSGFEYYRKFFDNLPEMVPGGEGRLQHSSFAVLMILVVKQAFFHTLRARLEGHSHTKIMFLTRTNIGNIDVECVVTNPEVLPTERSEVAKDAAELRDLAERLSFVGGSLTGYRVLGPSFDAQSGLWRTTVQILSKR